MIVHIDNSMSHNGPMIQKYCARKKMTRIAHPVYSPDLSPCDVWFFGYAREKLKDQLITVESDLEDKLTHIWEHGSWDVPQSVFFEWMERLEWVIEHGETIISIGIN
jgi:hypothetical protein